MRRGTSRAGRKPVLRPVRDLEITRLTREAIRAVVVSEGGGASAEGTLVGDHLDKCMALYNKAFGHGAALAFLWREYQEYQKELSGK